MKHALLPLLLIPALAALPACRADETVRGYGGADKTWVLQEIDGTGFSARATLTFPEEGQIAGKAPCNSYFGEMSKPYPWFETGPLGATKMACPDLAAEDTFFKALSEMTLSEVSGDTLILSNDQGAQMVFKAE